EVPEDPHDVVVVGAQSPEPVCQRFRIRVLFRAEATVTAAGVRGAENPATGMGNRTHTWDAPSHHHANHAFALAVQTYAVWRNRRGTAVNECVDNIDELIFVDRAAAQFEIDPHMCRNRSGFVERGDVLRSSVHDRDEFFDVAEVAKRLYAACCGTGAQRHKRT